ncbi:hypothetical protein [Nonomuraea sp. NPDC048826]
MLVREVMLARPDDELRAEVEACLLTHTVPGIVRVKHVRRSP